MLQKLMVFTFLVVIASSLAAQNRTALVIGNSNYNQVPLKNPGNDARDMANTLRELGFEVIEKIDADQQQMEHAISAFGRTLEKKQGVGLLYYAGHGIQSKGENYLIPVGAVINRETELRYKAVNAARILDEMGYANNGLNIAILDACRNNPLTRSFRSSARGLARMNEAPKGLFLAYSTDPGNVAMDGDGRNSAFTAELIKAMNVEGLPIELVFKQVRRNVEKITKGQQTPFTTSSLSGDFYFIPPGSSDINPRYPVLSSDTKQDSISQISSLTVSPIEKSSFQKDSIVFIKDIDLNLKGQKAIYYHPNPMSWKWECILHSPNNSQIRKGSHFIVQEVKNSAHGSGASRDIFSTFLTKGAIEKIMCSSAQYYDNQEWLTKSELLKVLERHAKYIE